MVKYKRIRKREWSGIMNDLATPPEAIGADSIAGGRFAPGKNLGRNWFWITLLSLVNMYYTLSATPQYFLPALEVDYSTEIIYAIGFVLATACMITAPLIFRRLGVFDAPGGFRAVFRVLSGAGAALMVIFAVICDYFLPVSIWPLLIMQFVMTCIPAVIAGLSLHRAIKIIDVKQAAALCGLTHIFISLIASAHMGLIFLTESWTVMATSFVVIHVVLLLTPIILLSRNKDDFEYVAPVTSAYFPDSMFRKFIALAIVMATMDAFYDSSYYSGGGYSGYSSIFSIVIFILPAIFAVFIIITLRRGKWLPIMLACSLLVCFQQGLILFLGDNDALAVAYQLFDALSDPGNVIFLVFIPLIFCLQKRKNATAVIAMYSIWFLEAALTYFLQGIFGDAVSFIVAPAVAFTLSIAAIAFLFYLYSEHNRAYVKALIEDLKSQVGDGALPTNSAMADAGFSQEEIKVAMLLIEGNTRSDILRKLHMTAAEAGQHENSIRKKITAMGDPDPATAVIVAEFKLTKRETDMLRYLRRGLTNAAMAEELFLSEETVKIHVRNLMKKLPIDDRSEIALWAESFAVQSTPDRG